MYENLRLLAHENNWNSSSNNIIPSFWGKEWSPKHKTEIIKITTATTESRSFSKLLVSNLFLCQDILYKQVENSLQKTVLECKNGIPLWKYESCFLREQKFGELFPKNQIMGTQCEHYWNLRNIWGEDRSFTDILKDVKNKVLIPRLVVAFLHKPAFLMFTRAEKIIVFDGN